MSSHYTSRRHPASLLPRVFHDANLLELVKSPVTREMISKFETFFHSLLARVLFGARSIDHMLMGFRLLGANCDPSHQLLL